MSFATGVRNIHGNVLQFGQPYAVRRSVLGSPGNIPSELWLLSKLESLSLSNNNLTGENVEYRCFVQSRKRNLSKEIKRLPVIGGGRLGTCSTSELDGSTSLLATRLGFTPWFGILQAEHVWTVQSPIRSSPTTILTVKF